jgi:hypothetical protein
MGLNRGDLLPVQGTLAPPGVLAKPELVNIDLDLTGESSTAQLVAIATMAMGEGFDRAELRQVAA